MCDLCSRNPERTSCPICRDDTQTQSAEMSQPPPNVYVIGLLSLNKSRPISHDEPKMSFEKSLQTKAQQTIVVERCHECGENAEVKCARCKNNAYCQKCFAEVYSFCFYSCFLLFIFFRDLFSSFGVFNLGAMGAKWTPCESDVHSDPTFI